MPATIAKVVPDGTRENEEDQQLTGILTKLIYASWGAYLFACITGIFFNDRRLIVGTLLACAALFLPMGLLKRRHVQPSSLATTLILLAITTFLATFGQGIRDLAILAFPIIFIFAGLVLERRYFIVCIGLALMAIGWLALGEIFGWFTPAPISGGKWSYLIEVTIILSIAALAVDMLAVNMRRNLERARAEIALRKHMEAELRALFAGMTDVVIILDIDGRYIEIAPTNPGNLFRPANEMLGKTLYEILPKKPADVILDIIRLSIRNNQVTNGEYSLQIDGKETTFSISASRLSDTTAIIVAHDISERKRAEEQIRILSLTDELTGLFNRRGFTLLAEQELKLAHRSKRNMLLFFGDVDNLKTINDTHGHAQGDLALQEVSAILKKSFREADIVARIGGDEFVILAVDASLECADILSKRIHSNLEKRTQREGWPHPLTISLGIVRYDPEAPIPLSEMIAQADGQMYLQKQEKKGNKP